MTGRATTIYQPNPRVWVAVTGEATPKHVTAEDMAAAASLPAWRGAQLMAGRTLLRTLLRQVCAAASQAPIDPGTNGKPVLRGWPRLGINVSHDSGHVAACVGVDHHVGVDVQTVPAAISEPLVRRCAGRYRNWLLRLPAEQRAQALTWIWTAQEACVKAQGTGIGGLPWTIDVPPDALQGIWQGWRWRKLTFLSPIPLSCAWKEVPA